MATFKEIAKNNGFDSMADFVDEINQRVELSKNCHSI